jgi:hypothetical protein
MLQAEKNLSNGLSSDPETPIEGREEAAFRFGLL